ncbi:MAG: hypothetical protein JM58_07690 [Peptococcaceae bacterium BICA1-8]|nr:MAG: hypothetical protein JM58_07690 [Peptococcaceae bacterium BICA1-8]
MDTSKPKYDFSIEFNSYYQVLLKQITFILGDQNKAEDIVQDTLIKYYYTDKHTISHPKAWLIKVAVNSSYNYLRSEKNRKQREEKNIIFPSSINIEEVVIKKEQGQIVKDAISLLPERDKLLILLKYTGYSYTEIAQTLDIEEASVGTMLARAKKKFKEILLDKKGSELNAY